MTKLLALLSTIALACVGACATDASGGDDGPGPGPGPLPGKITPDQFLEQLITAECAKAFACKAEYPATTGTTFDDDWGASEAACLDDDDEYAQRAAVVAAIDAGQIDYDADAAASCLANPMYPATCADYFTTYERPAACDDVFDGKVADGGACSTDFACSGDTSICTNGKCAPDTTPTPRKRSKVR